jgi:hypothetical protein
MSTLILVLSHVIMKVAWVCWNGDRVSHFHGNFPKLRALIPFVHYSQRIADNSVLQVLHADTPLDTALLYECY